MTSFPAFVAQAVRAAKAANRRNTPRGLRVGVPLNYARNANGAYATDPATLNRIPRRRAVKVGPHWFNANTLRELVRRDPRNPRNPLTRARLPADVVARFRPPTQNRVAPRPQRNLALNLPPEVLSELRAHFGGPANTRSRNNRNRSNRNNRLQPAYQANMTALRARAAALEEQLRRGRERRGAPAPPAPPLPPPPTPRPVARRRAPNTNRAYTRVLPQLRQRLNNLRAQGRFNF